MQGTAARLLTLIMLLQRSPGQKAAELAAELGVSPRTIHRYLEMLGEMGIPVCTERGPYGGISLVRGYRLPPLVFSPREAVALHLGLEMVEEVWGPLYSDAARTARTRLANVMPEEQRSEAEWAQRSLVVTGMHQVAIEDVRERVEMAQSALQSGRQLELEYQAQDGRTSRRWVSPYALVHRWGWWYLVGYCHFRQELRSFRVDRARILRQGEAVVEAPDGFEIRRYLKQEWENQTFYTARLRFSPKAAGLATGSRSMWNELVETADGGAEASLSAPDLEWLARQVLSLGSGVIVLAPEELRHLVVQKAREVIAENN
jgi:predicted DNA-binding transcriptional regulator YafY